MKIPENPRAGAKGGAASDSPHARPTTQFSDVLKNHKQQTVETGVSKDAALPVPAFGPPFQLEDSKPVDAGRELARPDAILSSLAHEITVEAPPGGSSSVDIQFDSRTLQGLHVRVQKTGDTVEVRFSTSSEAVSRLLTSNADSLAQALVQRGYVAPSISVQTAPGPTAFSTGESRRSDRDGDRGKRDQGGGSQKRR
jgi:flagellar hook-length control protein FliK